MSSDFRADDTIGQRSRYVGATMRVCWQWVRDQIYAGVIAAGYDDLNPAHVDLIRYPTLGGLRPTKLADQVGITKQSVNDLLGHLEGHGYLVRVPDPADGRGRVIRLTAKGQRLERTINAQAQAAETQIADILGTRRFAQLQSALEELADGFTELTGEDEATRAASPVVG
jgi:DNA-binding MarR family transcriptional regulator